MRLLLEHPGERLIAVAPLAEVISNSGLLFPAPFVCVLWDHRETSPGTDEVALLAKRVLAAGCRYFMAAGMHTETWESVFDEVLTEPGRHDLACHVVTTSHHAEAPDEVAFFAINCTWVDDIRPTRHLVVHAGHSSLVDEVEQHMVTYASGAT